MVTIDFFHYSKRADTINKSLSAPTTLQGFLRDMTNVMRPVLKIKQQGVFTHNYCYIHELNRYYHIVNFNIIDTDTYEITLSVDVLKTYEQQIMGATGTVFERTDANKFISTRRQVYDVRPNFERLEFGNSNLFESEGNIIMVTLNGKN